jgi:O-antigen/teichoic acid export membrane protein
VSASAERRALTIDLLFNYASLALLAGGGLLANVVVARSLGEAGLGIFNQAYAVYIACSQLAVGGVHVSVLRSVAQAQADPPKQAQVVASGLALSLALGSAVAALVWLSRSALGAALGSPEVAEALGYVAPALLPFALNKTLLNTFNALLRMRYYALLQATRIAVLLATLIVLAWQERPATELTLALLAAELAVLLLALPPLCFQLGLRLGHVNRHWLRQHLSFGARGMLSGVFLELNTRIDVLAIGFFTSDDAVGRYSLAAVFAEGLYQCLIVARNQVNPVLARLVAQHDTTRLLVLVRRGWRYLYPGMAGLYLVGLGALYLLLKLHLQLPDPSGPLSCYLILGAGVWCVSGFVPFDGALLQAGYPAHYTLLTLLTAACNLALNVALIPVLGIQGAALGTALTLVLSIAFLSMIMRRQLGFHYLQSRADAA